MHVSKDGKEHVRTKNKPCRTNLQPSSLPLVCLLFHSYILSTFSTST